MNRIVIFPAIWHVCEIGLSN